MALNTFLARTNIQEIVLEEDFFILILWIVLTLGL